MYLIETLSQQYYIDSNRCM